MKKKTAKMSINKEKKSFLYNDGTRATNRRRTKIQMGMKQKTNEDRTTEIHQQPRSYR